ITAQRAKLEDLLNVRFGSKADIQPCLSDVCFTPNSGHWLSAVGCPLCAKSRHSGSSWDMMIVCLGRLLKFMEHHHETSPPQIPALGRGRCRFPGAGPLRTCASLSSSAGAYRRRLSGRNRERRHRTLCRRMAVRAAWSAIRGREPSRCCGERRGRSRGAGRTRSLLLVAAVHSISATLYKNLNFSFARDIAPVASIVRTTLVMEVNPSFPSKTVLDFIAYAKANPGKIAMASPGIGTIQHIAGELFQMMTDTEMVHVPYRGAPPALMDLIGGGVQVMFDVSVSSIEYIRSVKFVRL